MVLEGILKDVEGSTVEEKQNQNHDARRAGISLDDEEALPTRL
jgi:hypothetical protein